MAFHSGAAERVRAYLIDVPQQVRALAGDLSGQSVLDVGCGDTVADIGLLSLGVEHIHGLDVVPNWDALTEGVRQVEAAGYPLPPGYSSRISYTTYTGTRFPFSDDSFDFVFSWSAFEHIPDVPAALAEIRRVVKPFGQVLLQVYPWFDSRPGSHVSDYISEPFFQLKHPPEWVHERLLEYASGHPDERSFVLDHLWPEYNRLNRYSARQFLTDVLAAGFAVSKLESTFDSGSLEGAPPEVATADLLTAGTIVLLRPAKPFREEARLADQLRRETVRLEALLAQETLRLEKALADESSKRQSMEQSQSWRLTEPLRAFMQAVRRLRK